MWECGKLCVMELGFGVWGKVIMFIGMCKGRTRVFQGIVENSFGKSFEGQRREGAAKEFSKRLWENGGNPCGYFPDTWRQTDKGFPRFST